MKSCIACLIGGYKQQRAFDGRPQFICERCGKVWTNGMSGGEFALENEEPCPCGKPGHGQDIQCNPKTCKDCGKKNVFWFHDDFCEPCVNIYLNKMVKRL